MSQEKFDTLMQVVAAETEVEDLREFLETGLTEIAGLPARLNFNVRQNVCEVLVDLGPLPDAAPGTLFRQLLEHNHEAHEIGEPRTRYGLHDASGHVTGYVPLGIQEVEDPDSAMDILTECVEDAAFDLELLQEPHGSPEVAGPAAWPERLRAMPSPDAPDRDAP